MRPPDAAFADPRLAVLYDFFDDDRSDLEVYDDLVRELGAESVVDVGCGTGSLAVRLAARGVRVVALDPARASLDVARTKPYADRVTWLHGDATVLDGRAGSADLALMTGNVAQVFVDDTDWHTTLAAVRQGLGEDGWLVFETRRTDARAWEEWGAPPRDVTLPDGRAATIEWSVTEVAPSLVSFESLLIVGDERLASASTLRFRGRREIDADLARHGFEVVEVRDAPDRPGKELVFLARVRGCPA